MRFRHTAVRVVLSMPERPLRHVPVPQCNRRGRLDADRRYERRHTGIRKLAHRLAELMVTTEEWVVPIFTKSDVVGLGMVCSCVSVAGLGATTSQGLTVIEPASSVAVVGCGPLGLSAVQGARIAGASMIIAIDPIRVRRELAMRVGATHVLDPNADRDNLVQRVRELTTWPTDRL